MKKLLLKLISVLSVPIILWYLYALNFTAYYMDDEYPHCMQQKDHVNNSSDYNDIIIIGDSATKADMLAYSVGDKSVYNISLSSATSVEAYISLRNYLENHGSPETVIAMFSVKSLTSNEWLRTRMLYFRYYSLSELSELYKKGRELKDPYWTADGIEGDMLRYYLRDPGLYLPAVRNSNFFGRYDANTRIYEQTAQDRGWLSFGTNENNYDEADIEKLEHFEVVPMQDYYIHKIIELCEEKDIDLIIEQIPIKESALEETDENVLDEFEGYFTELQNDYPDVTINPSPVFYSNVYFCDYAHLNPVGAEKFTAEIYDKYFPDDI
ncbi:MAG: hypothetical protein J1F11_07490 [Oscillospiraceae bacterium]|nr:hypothetical protein [Oscillospiraceae bacterium]